MAGDPAAVHGDFAARRAQVVAPGRRPWRGPKSQAGRDRIPGRIVHGLPRPRRRPAAPGARALGADAADMLIAEGTDFSVTVRKGEVETLKDAGSKALGLRVFVGRRTAQAYTSDFSAPALRDIRGETRGHGAGAPARTRPQGCPTSVPRRGHRPRPLRPLARGPPHRRAHRAGAARRSGRARGLPGDHQLAGRVVRLRRGLRGARQHPRLHGLVPLVGRARSRWFPSPSATAHMERDYWYTNGRGPRRPPAAGGSRAASPPSGRCAGWARARCPPARCPIVFDPETAAEILGARLPRASPATPCSATPRS